MSDLADLQQKQADAAKLAMRMVDEKDPARLQELAGELQERCAALEKMARGMEAAWTPPGGTGAEVRVLLTAEQRERIAQQTGVGVELVVLNDSPERAWSKEMPTVEPREIERLAAQQAAASRLRMETQKQVEKIIHELEKLNVPELAGTIAELKKDPTLGLARKGR